MNLHINGKRVLTTGQLSKALGVSPRTVSHWCDGGKIPSYRLPSNGSNQAGDRRVLASDAMVFAQANNFPTHGLEKFTDRVIATKILLIVSSDSLARMLTVLLNQELDDVEVRHASDLIAAGSCLACQKYAVVLVDSALGGEAIRLLYHHREELLHDAAVVVLIPEDVPGLPEPIADWCAAAMVLPIAPAEIVQELVKLVKLVLCKEGCP